MLDDRLLDSPRLFQQLLIRDLDERFAVASDLDVGSFDEVPFVTHSALISQADNGLWDVTLTINLFLPPEQGHALASVVYAVIVTWGRDPSETIIDDVGAIESIEDMNAFVPVSGVVQMNNKAVRQYQGSFTMTARVH